LEEATRWQPGLLIPTPAVQAGPLLQHILRIGNDDMKRV